MGLSKEEKATLEALNKKANEPDELPGNVSFSLDLSSDSAWERAKKLGIIPGDPPADDDDDDDDDLDDAPKRRGFMEKK